MQTFGSRNDGRIAILAILVCGMCGRLGYAEEAVFPRVIVKSTKDFELRGDGSHQAWKVAKWQALQLRAEASANLRTRFKTLYSRTGIYFLFDGQDERLTATLKDDFENLWTEDVFEVFLWTDERYPVYFEYEISPLNKELPSNFADG